MSPLWTARFQAPVGGEEQVQENQHHQQAETVHNMNVPVD